MNSFTETKKSASLKEIIKLLSHKPSATLIQPGDVDYEKARLIYNRMHVSAPALIVRTLDVDFLRKVISFAFKNNIELAIRGGGHHIAGFSTCNGGIVIDFSPFKEIKLNKKQEIVSVSPGVCLGDIDKELAKHGYILPTGTISETGLAGLTLGGGIGWLIGKYGLTCDQLCGADVLLANGQLIRAEDPEHEDLLWALKGGGGNFGIVLNFRYKLNALPKVTCGMGRVPWHKAADALKKLNHYLAESCPPSMTVAPVFIKDKFGKPSFRIDFCCADGTSQDIAMLLSLSESIEWIEIKEWDFVAWQSAFDEILLPPKRGYWKAAYIETLTEDNIEHLCRAFENSPPWECTILIEHLHGAFKHFDQTTSAFPLRHTNLGVLFSARWQDAADDQESIRWVRQSFSAIDPKELSGTYSNYTFADDKRAVADLLKNTLSRIEKVKLFYDPHNYFKRNHNVRPIKS